MNTRGLMSMLAAVVLAVGLTGCGEQPQVVSYEQGKYQGKADSQPWDNPVFKGDKAAWELAMKNRTRGQNEYNRTQ
ncbi:hypothetical protein J5J83_16775 [Azoarcus sp. L1K30]|uniref:hypothetical protein n=1 Tax=Azoarcus sp. L1K30 TaxID=2820277 RepID=UPI001B82B53C|nr:hypothetical protein [Azoarcus sp. L1K30]MBR0567781.1 hypothetical protein [Azoarcus sp. L1K30]